MWQGVVSLSYVLKSRSMVTAIVFEWLEIMKWSLYVQILSRHRCLCDYIISPFTHSRLSRETRVDWLKAIFLVILFDIHIDFTHSRSSHLLQAMG